MAANVKILERSFKEGGRTLKQYSDDLREQLESAQNFKAEERTADIVCYWRAIPVEWIALDFKK